MKIEANPEAPVEANSENAHTVSDGQMSLLSVPLLSQPLLSQPLLSLPLLHCGSVAQNWRTATPHLWPGLPNMPETGYRALAGYPFSPDEALACLRDLDAMSVAGVSGVPLQALAAQEHRPQSARELEEKEALRRFAATGEGAMDSPAAHDDTLLRKAAHKALLWAWLLEERQREVSDLASNFDATANHLMDALGVEEDNDFTALHAIDMHFGQDTNLLPSWKLVVRNAALFLPHPCAIVVNDARMAEAVTEMCAEHNDSFEDVDADTHARLGLPAQPGMVWKRAELPLWKIAGLRAAAPQYAWLNRQGYILLPQPCVPSTDKGAA